MAFEKNQEVLVTVRGLQFQDGEDDNIEIVTRGRYYKRADKRYLFYEEEGEQPWERVKNLVEVGRTHVDVIKKGMIETRLSFEEGQKLYSIYKTPFGRMEIGVFTEKLDVRDAPGGMDLTINYRLEVNNQHMSDNIIRIQANAMAAN